MQKKCNSKSGFFNLRTLAIITLCSIGMFLAMLSFAGTPSSQSKELSHSGQRSSDMTKVMPQAPATPGNWSIVSSPNTGFATTTLSAVTCVTASDCWAVGRSEIGHTYASTTLMRWDGTSWHVVPSPSLDEKTNGLVAISCLSSSSCWAVGYHIILQTVEVKTLILRWDGSTWTIIPSPNVGDGFNALYGVACAAESNCWAVGFENGGSQARTLIQKWDGASWTIQDSPNVGSENNVLNAITCQSTSNCLAVGYSGTTGAKSGLVVRWDGNMWTASALPNQPLNQEETLSDVACNSASDCWAVGDSYNGTVHQSLIDRWNGVSWTNVIAPNGSTDNYLSDVTCASASDCWAVGHSNNAAVDPELDQALVMHWNGLVWLPTPVQSTTYSSDLAGVACASGIQCWAVGSIKPAGNGLSLIERWDGTSWTPVDAPEVPLMQANYLDSVSCLSESDCWAVGFDFYGTVARSLIMHWNGTAWGINDSPNTAIDRSNYLDDITCVSTADCWAIGSSTNTIGVQSDALTMHWDGTAWSIVNAAPIDPSQVIETSFRGVACTSTSDCWAVGFSLAQDYQGLIEHWNGTGWTIVPTPPQEKSILYDVACTSASDCTAVGVQWTTPVTGSALYQTLVEHWDGTSWSVVASPNTAPDQDNILSAVACSSVTDCWAVGSSNNYSQALVEHWNGISWTIVSSPPAGRILNAVTCLSSSDCWAAGPYYIPNPPAQTLLEHWDGTAWSVVASPNTGPSQSNNLAGIACASASQCWAVGQYHGSGGRTQSLILKYGPTPPLTNIASRKLHGSAGAFDIDLPIAGSPGIECRSGGANGDHTIVFTFANALTSVGGASISNGIGTVSSATIGADNHQYIVGLTGVANAQRLELTLNNVTDADGNVATAISVPMNVLLGDTTHDGFVNSADIAQTKSQSGVAITSSNFREDVNADGSLNSSDIALVRSKSGTALP